MPGSVLGVGSGTQTTPLNGKKKRVSGISPTKMGMVKRIRENEPTKLIQHSGGWNGIIWIFFVIKLRT